MKITSVSFELKASEPGEFPKGDMPEIAFAGRSNVGKSSLINVLIKRKSLARTSSTPGKTRALYYYLVNNKIYLVDLPGYGFAKVSKSLRLAWGGLMENYLHEREQLKGCILVVDIRHPPQDLDCRMAAWLVDKGLPFLVVAAKADKISKNRQQKSISELRQGLCPGQKLPVVPFSNVTGQGRTEIWAFIMEK